MFSNDASHIFISLIPCQKKDLKRFLKQQSKVAQHWLMQSDFKAASGEFCAVPNEKGDIESVVFGIDKTVEYRWVLSSLAEKLPKGNYRLVADWSHEQQQQAVIGWGLACYQYDRYKASKRIAPTLYVEKDLERVNAFVNAFTLVRDLVNTPAADMMPQDLAQTAKRLAKNFDAEFKQIKGKNLLRENYPCIHAVGRASKHDPRLICLRWGEKSHPRVSLVGKGVCFDTGGLDLKPSQSMRLMKKDMGGAAHVLGMAQLIMALKLPVRLEVLVSAADNAISEDAFRPGDVLDTRAGKTVEVDNTDAEGRLVLCDALTHAGENNPDLIIDFATLTGAARVAMGTEVPAYFTNTDTLAVEIDQAAAQSGELVWQLPMHKPYRSFLNSDIADLLNSAPQGYGGAITAALYLNEFVDKKIPWAHFDMMAYNNRHRPGRPEGGEAMGILAVYQLLENKYAAFGKDT